MESKKFKELNLPEVWQGEKETIFGTLEFDNKISQQHCQPAECGLVPLLPLLPSLFPNREARASGDRQEYGNVGDILFDRHHNRC